MEDFENEQLHSEHPYQEEPTAQPQNEPISEQQPYSGEGVGRKESPFADSPYVMNRNTTTSFGATPPVPPREHPAKAHKSGRKGGKGLKRVLAAVLALVVVAAGCGITAIAVNSHWEARTAQMKQDFDQQISALQEQVKAAAKAAQAGASVPTVVDIAGNMSAGQVYASNVQSVVLITCKVTTTSYGRTMSGTSAGSGFVLTKDGYIITNHHVIENATSVKVSTYDGTEYDAQIIGSDSTNDVAVLKVDAEDLSAVTIGSSDDLVVGDQVVAIGNPLGELTSTLTVGYVSAKDRDVTTEGTILNMIQTDAAINSGNSGGPLFNMKGEVVGITTAKYSGSSSSGASIEGIGFAIPIDDVMPLMDDLINYGYVNSAYLGVMVSNMDEETAAYYNLPIGVYVQEVTPGYAAEKAGVQAKDIIVALGDCNVSNTSDLTRLLRNYKAGDKTTLTVYRSGAKVVLDITLDEKPQTTAEENTQTPSTENMPEEGNFEDWYNYFAPFFGNGNG